MDCDGVLSQCVESFLQLAADKFNVFATPGQVTGDQIGPSIGCPGLEYLIDEQVLHHEFVYRMKPITEGLEFFKTLEETYGKDNVYVCTKVWSGGPGDNREKATGEWASQRYAWLRDHLGVLRKRVYMAGVKKHVQGILIDDSINNLKGRPKGHTFCIARPYNTGYGGPRGDYQDCLEWLKNQLSDPVIIDHGLGMEGRCNKCGARSCNGFHKGVVK